MISQIFSKKSVFFEVGFSIFFLENGCAEIFFYAKLSQTSKKIICEITGKLRCLLWNLNFDPKKPVTWKRLRFGTEVRFFSSRLVVLKLFFATWRILVSDTLARIILKQRISPCVLRRRKNWCWDIFLKNPRGWFRCYFLMMPNLPFEL